MRTIFMRLRWKCIFVVWLICAATGKISGQHGPYGYYSGPNSLGTYSHDRAITIKSFLAYFGTVPSLRDTYCIPGTNQEDESGVSCPVGCDRA